MNIMPFLLFAFVASITPGPTNILILNNSQHFGVRATIPALAVVSLFAPAGEHALREVTLMALWFLLISIACLMCWTWLGKAVNRVFRTTVAMVRLQRLMALCLLVSSWAGMLA